VRHHFGQTIAEYLVVATGFVGAFFWANNTQCPAYDNCIAQLTYTLGNRYEGFARSISAVQLYPGANPQSFPSDPVSDGFSSVSPNRLMGTGPNNDLPDLQEGALRFVQASAAGDPATVQDAEGNMAEPVLVVDCSSDVVLGFVYKQPNVEAYYDAVTLQQTDLSGYCLRDSSPVYHDTDGRLIGMVDNESGKFFAALPFVPGGPAVQSSAEVIFVKLLVPSPPPEGSSLSAGNRITRCVVIDLADDTSFDALENDGDDIFLIVNRDAPFDVDPAESSEATRLLGTVQISKNNDANCPGNRVIQRPMN